MVSSTTIGLIVGYVVSLITIAASSYGLGREETKKEGSGYKAAVAFYILGLLGLLGTTIGLVMFVATPSGGPAITQGLKFIQSRNAPSMVPEIAEIVSSSASGQPEVFVPSLPPLIV